MGEYLAAPALLDEPAVQQSFLSYFNTTVDRCVSGRRSMFIMERDACAPVDASVRARAAIVESCGSSTNRESYGPTKHLVGVYGSSKVPSG